MTIYAISIAIWSQMFLIYWNRKSSEIAVEWGNYDEDYDKENERRQFKGEWVKSPITEQYEKHYPLKNRFSKYLYSLLVSIPFVILGLIINIVFLNLSGFIKPHMNSALEIKFLGRLSEPGEIFATDSFLNTFIGIAQVIIIAKINSIYRKAAVSTTDNENHRIKTNYDNSLIFKMFVFEFFNSFISLYYLAFSIQDYEALGKNIVIAF
jgi:hypothetical protein